MNDDMNNKNELVVKANCLVEASYRLSLSQQRLILLSITESRRTGTGLTVDSILVIRAADYAETFDVPLNEAYVQLKDAGHSLFMRYVVLYDWNPKTKRNDKINLHWLSYVKYKEGEGEVEIQFSQQMVPYITWCLTLQGSNPISQNTL